MTATPTSLRPAHAPAPARSSATATAMRRYLTPTVLGWLVPALIAAVGGMMRFFRLGHPNTLIFDETYYVKEGWSLANF
ncbi:MAG: phospholipid carrier-dependent glycosyltransferase, partial [Brevibacterium yomogidense]